MTPNLTSLPLPPVGSGNLPASQNSVLTQHDSELSGDFQALLSAGNGIAPGAAAGVPLALQADPVMPMELQALPQHGSVLPLLEQLIAGSAPNGAEGRALLQRMAAALERSGTVNEPQLAERIEQVLQLLGEGDSVPAGIVPGELVALTIAERGPGAAPAAAAQAGGRSLPQIPDWLRPPDGSATGQGKTPGDAGRDQWASLTARLADVGPQASSETGQRMSEPLALLAALRQAGNGLKPNAPLTTAPLEPVSAAPPQTLMPVTGHAAGNAVPTLSVDVPMQQANWNQALGERIQWLMGQRLQGAQIRLNPAHLGPLEVRVQMQQDQASIHFTSAHAVVREALEAALPRLRDMFESAGVQLLDVDVSGQSLGQQERTPQHAAPPVLQHFSNAGEDSVETVLESPVASLLVAGRLDLFA